MHDDDEIVRSHCNTCGRVTKHLVLHVKETRDSEELEDYGPIFWDNTYELLECRGCESISLKHTNIFEPTEEVDVTIYPPRVTRRKPHWFYQIPSAVRTLLQQIYQALDANSRALALMGARAVLDMVLVETVGDQGSFGAKLDALEKHGAIGAKSKEILRAALDAGNAASHRGYQPTTDDINAVMDIVENLLQAVYHLKTLAESLKKATPTRSQKKK